MTFPLRISTTSWSGFCWRLTIKRACCHKHMLASRQTLRATRTSKQLPSERIPTRARMMVQLGGRAAVAYSSRSWLYSSYGRYSRLGIWALKWSWMRVRQQYATTWWHGSLFVYVFGTKVEPIQGQTGAWQSRSKQRLARATVPQRQFCSPPLLLVMRKLVITVHKAKCGTFTVAAAPLKRLELFRGSNSRPCATPFSSPLSLFLVKMPKSD